MRYWIADIEERNGEFEYTTVIRFRAKTLEDADDLHKQHVRTWYGKDHMVWVDIDGCYYNDHVAVSEGALTEIDERTYEKLSGHHSLPDMSEVVRR